MGMSMDMGMDMGMGMGMCMCMIIGMVTSNDMVTITHQTRVTNKLTTVAQQDRQLVLVVRTELDFGGVLEIARKCH